MFAHDAFTSIFGAVLPGELDTLTGVARAALRAGYAVILNYPGTKKPLCIHTTAQAKKKADSATYDADMAAGVDKPRRAHPCAEHHVLFGEDEAKKVSALIAKVTKAYGGVPNIGLEAGRSRLLVADMDTAEQRDAFLATWQAEDPETCPPPDGLYTVHSPGQEENGEWGHKDGGHVWFTLPDGMELPTHEGRGVLTGEGDWSLIWSGLQVLVPPSARKEGAYRLVGSPRPAPRWLLDRIETERGLRADRAVLQAERSAARVARLAERGELDPSDVGLSDEAMPWACILTERGWSVTGRVDTCGCDTWTAPGPHASPKSATAHAFGCTRPEYDDELPHRPIKLWSDTVLPGAPRVLTKLQFLAWWDYQGGGPEQIAAVQAEHGWVLNPETGENAAADRDQAANQAVEDAVQELSTADPQPVDNPPPPDLPRDDDRVGFWDSRPLLKTVRDYALARYLSPWSVLGTVLARTSVLIHPAVTLPPLVGSKASLNLFVGLVGPSAGGKSQSMALADEVVRPRRETGGFASAAELATPSRFVTAQIGSGQGVAHVFGRYTKDKGVTRTAVSALLTMPEIDSITAHAAMGGATILSVLRSVYSGEDLGHAYVDPTKRIPIPEHTYRAAIVVGIQPERGAALLADEGGGTPQRFVFLPTTWHGEGVGGPEPEAFDWDVPDWAGDVLCDPETGPAPSPPSRHVQVCESAAQAVRATRVANLRGEVPAIDGHSLLTRLKVGALFGALDGRCEVSEQDWWLAGEVMRISDRTRESMRSVVDAAEQAVVTRKAAQFVEANETAKVIAAMERVMRWIRKYPNEKPPTAAEMVKKITKTLQDSVPDAIRALLTQGELISEVHEVPGGGKDRHVLRLP